jgi:hypothetical protein
MKEIKRMTAMTIAGTSEILTAAAKYFGLLKAHAELLEAAVKMSKAARRRQAGRNRTFLG